MNIINFINRNKFINVKAKKYKNSFIILNSIIPIMKE